MDYNFDNEFDLETTYQKLIAPSKPRVIKACDFFKQPDLLPCLQRKIAQTAAQPSRVKTNR